MTGRPDWLPEMVSVNGERNEVLVRLYSIFVADFKRTRRLFDGRPVWWDRRILAGEVYEEGFWHLITRNDMETKERLFDPRRGERLPWCGPTISNAADGAVKVWDYMEASGCLRTYIWLEGWDYVIVLEKRQMRVGEVVILITAFYVDGESRRRNLQTKYGRRKD